MRIYFSIMDSIEDESLIVYGLAMIGREMQVVLETNGMRCPFLYIPATRISRVNLLDGRALGS